MWLRLWPKSWKTEHASTGRTGPHDSRVSLLWWFWRHVMWKTSPPPSNSNPKHLAITIRFKACMASSARGEEVFCCLSDHILGDGSRSTCSETILSLLRKHAARALCYGSTPVFPQLWQNAGTVSTVGLVVGTHTMRSPVSLTSERRVCFREAARGRLWPQSVPKWAACTALM